MDGTLVAAHNGDAGLSANLQMGAFGNLEAEQIQNYAFQRAATLHLADAWHIPAPTTAEITDQIKTLRMFAGQDGQFDAKAYQTFRDNLKTNPRGVREADILRVVADDTPSQMCSARWEMQNIAPRAVWRILPAPA